MKKLYEFDSFPEYDNWQKNIFRQDDNYDEIIYEISQNERIRNIVQKISRIKNIKTKTNSMYIFFFMFK